MSGTGHSRALRGAALMLCLVSATYALGHSGTGNLEHINLRVAFTRQSFLGVNEADAKAAFKVFAMRMGEKRGYDITPEVRIFEDPAELAREAERDTPELIIIDTWDFLGHGPFANAPVEFAAIEQGVTSEPYFLLVKRGSAIGSIPDLRDKHVIVLESGNANNGRHWLLTELLALGVSDPASFVGKLESKHKVSQVVLPVFFGQADACVVDQSGFDVMTDMNPQIGNELDVIVESPSVLDTICCVKLKGWDETRQRADLMDALMEMPDDPAGRQILALFRFDGMTAFADEHIETVRTLRERHDALNL